MIPTGEEVAMGKDIHQQILSQYKLCQRPDVVARVQNLGRTLAAVSDRQDLPYHFYVLESKELNAFTVPGGSIYVFTGLLDKLKSDAEVAAVIAHEIGHCAARHTIKKFQAALGYQLIGGVVLSQLGVQDQSFASMSTNAVMQLVFSAYGRKDEYQADLLGIKYLNRAGYDMNGMVKTLEVLQREAEKSGGPPLILRSHPYAKDRVVMAKAEIARIIAQKAQ